jgi:hypothetical protein
MYWKDVTGWLYDKEGEALQQVCYNKKVLEIGPWMGRSTCAIADVALKVITIDHFEGDPCIHAAYSPLPHNEVFFALRENLRECGCTDWVTVVDAKWEVHLADNPRLLQEAEVVFYDADHSVKPVTDFFVMFKTFPGIICVHDYGKAEYKLSTAVIDGFLKIINRPYRVVGSLLIVGG